jgi:Ca2+-binding RTX toxin-like protein
MSGGSGIDFISGGEGANTIDGGRGNDTIYIGSNFYNKVSGGSGFDTLHFNDGFAAITQGVLVDLLTGQTGGGAEGNEIDTIEGLGGTEFNDILRGDDVRNTLEGEGGSDRLEGRGGNDTLQGNNGDDTLLGGAGNDVLYGDYDTFHLGIGNDRLYGGGGQDYLEGGLGRDMFVYTALSDSGITASTRDYITDLTRSEGDRIDVSAIDANSLVSGNQAFRLDKGGAFSAGEIKQVVSGGELILMFNTDGDAAAEMSIRVALHTSVSAADFVF